MFLGWVRSAGVDGIGRDFYLRQLRDSKGSAESETMLPEGMRVYSEVCGWAPARGHARSGDAVAVAAHLGSGPSFDLPVPEFAEKGADQNARDHQSLVSAMAAGGIEAQAGV
jgi:hypothetical protein